MQRLTIVLDPLEAQMISEKLGSVGIAVENRGARDYASIVTGTQLGRYELFVDDENLAKAQDLLREMNMSLVKDGERENQDHRPPDYLKRAVAFAIFGTVVLPIVFNIFSVIALKKYWQQSQKDSRTKAIIAVLLLLQIPGIAVATIVLRSYFTS
jgi:hypothetical protein